MKLLALGFLVLAAPGTSQAQQEPAWVSMTLEEALERALKQNPQVIQAAGSIRTAKASERSAFGAYLPSLSASANSTLSSSDRLNPDTGTIISGSNDSYSAGLSASWDVFTGGRRSSARRQAQAELQSAEAQLTAQRFGVAQSVQSAFFEALRAAELMAVTQSRIELAQQGITAAERRLAVGSATRSDVLRAQLELNTARESLLQQESQRYTAALTLGRLTGLEQPVAPSTSAPIEPTPLTVSREELMNTLLAKAPSVRSAEAALTAAEASITSAKAQYLPSVGLSAGYNWFNEDLALTGGRTSWSVRLGLSYPIFDGFLREEGVVRARTQAEVAQAQLADAQHAVRTETERVLSLLKLAEERVVLSRQAVEVAQEDLRVQQERYRLGATTILELLTSQTALVAAQNNLVGLRFDYLLSRAELESIAGRKL
ncbi:TolC family protein [Stigmatella sp. ncwal1]|uniref:TolC family protein n=1 Tax=Stigmatella ashevillensis TaxID=2995309 RepID=A0ABT5DQF4_9BACT|nr:TolC family protein [Stigmatella ashevillena]MDC0714601.1 TolC family protein [Stigmatella ashevillena]